jgi:hypothetical protein
LNQGRNLGTFSLRPGRDRDITFRYLLSLEQARRVRQTNAVDEIQPHLIAFDRDQAYGAFDPSANVGAVIRQAPPTDRLFSLWDGPPHHRS